MSRTPLAFVVAVAFAIATTVFGRVAVAPTYKPVTMRAYTVTPIAVMPVTFEELWHESAAVVEGVVEKTEPLVHAQAPSSRVTLRVVEVFKGGAAADRRPGDEIHVVVAGAVTDRGEFVESVEDPTAPLPRRNQRSILFLDDSGDGDGLRLVTRTHDSLYLVDGPWVASRGQSPLAQSLARQSHGEFAARLRARNALD